MKVCILSNSHDNRAAGGGCVIKAPATRVPGDLDTLHFSLHEVRPAAAAVT